MAINATEGAEQPAAVQENSENSIVEPDTKISQRRPLLYGLKKRFAAVAAAVTLLGPGNPALPPNSQGTETSRADSAIPTLVSEFSQPTGTLASIDNRSELLKPRDLDLKKLIEQADFDPNGSIEVTSYKEPPYFFPPGTEFIKVKGASILFRGKPDIVTGAETFIAGVRAREFGNRIVLFSGEMQPETVICDANSELLGRGPDALPLSSARIDFSVNFDYETEGPIKTAADEATNVGSADELIRKLKEPADPNDIRPIFVVPTRVQQAGNQVAPNPPTSQS